MPRIWSGRTRRFCSGLEVWLWRFWAFDSWLPGMGHLHLPRESCLELRFQGPLSVSWRCGTRTFASFASSSSSFPPPPDSEFSNFSLAFVSSLSRDSTLHSPGQFEFSNFSLAFVSSLSRDSTLHSPGQFPCPAHGPYGAPLSRCPLDRNRQANQQQQQKLANSTVT
jgi:hypothetical protein